MDNKNEKQCDLGIVGLGTMGKNLLFNMADHGFKVVGYDKDKNKVANLQSAPEGPNAYGALNLSEFLGLLKKPRIIMLLVPAGAPVSAAIDELLPHLHPGDLIIDAGNSHFTDTDTRMRELDKQGIQFMGTGVSGGEQGARLGPSIMPGGSEKAYEQIRPIFEAIAAKTQDGRPCVAYLGKGAVGHFVKMVHNGIEYGIMQLIAETYALMKYGLNLSNDQLCAIYHSWDHSELNSYLLKITSEIFARHDEKTGHALIDEILNVARQNGTGMWTSQSAMALQVPVPTIDLAVSMRDLSVQLEEHTAASLLYKRRNPDLNINRDGFLNNLQDALFIGMIIVYAQGLSLLRTASIKYDYHLDLECVAKIWQGGCIIRAKILEDICAAFRSNRNLPNLLLDPTLSQKIITHQESLRHVSCQAILLGIAAPAFMVTLSYFDAYRSGWSPASLIQAQRDYFGAHGYERRDSKGTFHTEWEKGLSI